MRVTFVDFSLFLQAFLNESDKLCFRGFKLKFVAIWSLLFKICHFLTYLENTDSDQNVSFVDFALVFIACFRTPNFSIDGCICKNVFLKFQVEGISWGYFSDFACLPELKKCQNFTLTRCGSSMANFELSKK